MVAGSCSPPPETWWLLVADMANYNWSAISTDVAHEIVTHLDFEEDLIAFSHVCSGWRSALKMIPKAYIGNVIRRCLPPLLMLAEPSHTPYRRFHSFVSGKSRRIDLPYYDHDHVHDRYFSSRGWIISLTLNAQKITLFNPESSEIIEAPTVPDHLIPTCKDEWEDDPWKKSLFLYQKFILSSHHPTKIKDFVAVIFEINNKVGFWRIGHDEWVKPVTGPGESTIFNPRFCYDVCFHNGKFYTINDHKQVIAFTNDHNGINWHAKILTDLKSRGLIGDRLPIDSCYLVGEWEQDLILVVCRLVILRGDTRYFTRRFYVFEVNVETGEARKVESLGGRAIFVGFNSTFFVEASSLGDEHGWDERGCKPNCIYFTDDNYEYYAVRTLGGGGSDMGIYSLDESKVMDDHIYQGPIASTYSFTAPPMWVENSPTANISRCFS